MPDETTQKNALVLPPKLTARRIMPATAPVVRPVDIPVVAAVPAATPAPIAPIVVPAPAPVARAPVTPAVVPVQAAPAIAPVPVTVVPGQQAAQGIKADRKKDTSKLSIEDARPSYVDAAGPAVKTVRLKSPSDMASGGKIEPLIITAAKPAAGVDDAAQGIQAKRKSDTSRIDIDSIVKSQDAVTSATAPGGVRTVRIKSGPTVAAFVGTQSIGGIDRKVANPVASPVVSKTPAGQTAVESKPAAGPATIRLKKPEGLKQSASSRFGGETARILPDTSTEAPGAQAADPEEQGSPRTVRIKRPDGSEAPAVDAASAATGRKTMKVSRPGQAPVQSAQEPRAVEDAPLTQRRTLSIKRQEDKVSDRSAKMAQQEAALQGDGRKKALEPGQKPLERFAWAWCIVSTAAVIVIACVIWVFVVQLRPTVEMKIDRPGKILSASDSFYRNEPEWKMF